MVVYRIASGKRRIPARRSCKPGDPDCGTILRDAKQDGEPMGDSVQHQTAEFGVCDFVEVTATIGEGSGESSNLPVGPHELILADAGYCSVAGIEYVWQHDAEVLVRVNPQRFVAYSAYGRRFSLLPRLRTLSKVGQFREWRVVLHGQGSSFAGRLCAIRKSNCAIQQAHRRLQRKTSKKQMITGPGTLEFAKYVIVFTTRSSGFNGGCSEVLPYALAN